MYEKYGNWGEMGPYGSVGAHIKTGKSPMAYGHFWTPPDPKRGAPLMEEAVLEMCAWSPFANYIYSILW